MGTKPHQLQGFIVRLPIDQNEVRPHMTIAVILPVAGKGVVTVPGFQRLILRQSGQHRHQKRIQ